jgi:hypothetical protein
MMEIHFDETTRAGRARHLWWCVIRWERGDDRVKDREG